MNDWIVVKGDISGIQEFIFNVKSKGAAKTLKSRSFYIDAICLLAESYIKQKFSECETIYVGGGNLYLKIPIAKWDIKVFDEIQVFFLKYFNDSSISLNIEYHEFKNTDNYGEIIDELNRKTNKFKITKFTKLDKKYFDPFIKTDFLLQNKFINFSYEFIDNNSFEIENTSNIEQNISFNKIELFGQSLKLSKSSKNKYQTNIPIWKSDIINEYVSYNSYKGNDSEALIPEKKSIIDFESFGKFAEMRTGTNKIAAVKLDLDNLGTLFKNTKNENDNKYLSERIDYFFNKELYSLIKDTLIDYEIVNGEVIKIDSKKFEGKKIEIYQTFKKNYKLEDNIYVVFAGGDDSFIIGAWDSIIEFTILLREKFNEFQKEIIKKLNLKNPITFSAAIIIVDAHYPIVKIAEDVENELHKIKNENLIESKVDATGHPMKNKISLFQHNFTFEDFLVMKKFKDKFYEMIIIYGENRAFLYKIQDLFAGINPTEDLKPNLLWMFKYIFRDIAQKIYFKEFLYDFYFAQESNLEKELYRNFKQPSNKDLKIPVAARWTELLTRKK